MNLFATNFGGRTCPLQNAPKHLPISTNAGTRSSAGRSTFRGTHLGSAKS